MPAVVGGAPCPRARGRELSPRPWKLEKADILEMTVRFLRGLPVAPRPAPGPPAPRPRLRPAASPDGYLAGFRACLQRLARVLPACRALEPAARARLLEHLRHRAAGAPPDGSSPRDPRDAPDPAPALAPPVPPGQPGLWRPW